MNDELKEINIIPLVDVMLVLVVIILMTATFITTGRMQVNVPDAQSSDPVTLEKWHLEMTKEGSIRLDGKSVMQDELILFLSDKNREDAILISADRSVTLQAFIHLLDQLKLSGFRHISVQTQQ